MLSAARTLIRAIRLSLLIALVGYASYTRAFTILSSSSSSSSNKVSSGKINKALDIQLQQQQRYSAVKKVSSVEFFRLKSLKRDDHVGTNLVPTSRRNLLNFATIFACLQLSFPAFAREKLDPTLARQKIEDELNSANGGVARLQSAISTQDFPTILDFTKTYDQILRKNYMGALKPSLVDGDRATSLANAVTFDLIGINRASRPGQNQSRDQAQKYLDELKADVQAFLQLEVKKD